MAAAELRPDIAAARNRLKAAKLGAGRELKKLEEYLAPDETVNTLAIGLFAGGQGLLALTDRRMLFVLESITKRTSEDFPLRAVSSVSWQSGMLSGTIVITVAGNKAAISSVLKEDGKAFVDRAREAVAEAATAAAPAAAAVPASASTADELVKLASLHAQGVLTAEEFAAAKARLLS